MSASELTKEHIIWAYRILLDRDPESDAVILPKLTAYRSTQQLRADIVTSREYIEKNPDFAQTNARTIVIKELAGGARLFVDLSDHAIGLPILRDQYEMSEAAFMRRVLKPGDHALDIGAHIGFFSVQMAQVVGPHGSVTAFEPFDENAALLERSIEENRFGDRLRLFRAAVSRATGEADLSFATETLNSGGAFLITGAAPQPTGHVSRRVRLLALDALPLPRPIAFVKMDVEGAEPLVLEGAAKLLAADRPVILSELHAQQLARVSAQSPEAFLAAMRGLGYRAFRVEAGQPGAELTAPSEPICTVALIPRERV
jgi:FkbM family methyltransferase